MQKIKFPLAIVNFKTFVCGKKAVALAKVCEAQSKISGVNVAVAVQFADIFQVANAVSIPVIAQHVDPVFRGQFTGSVLADSLKEAGAVGSLVNHSERPVDLLTLKNTVLRLHDAGILSVVCASTPQMAVEVSKFNPSIIAIEPPELIGGKIAVSEAEPEVITAAAKRIRRIPVLCGAGIHSGVDVKKSVELGVKGVLVASGVVCAKNPETAIDLYFNFGVFFPKTLTPISSSRIASNNLPNLEFTVL